MAASQGRFVADLVEQAAGASRGHANVDDLVVPKLDRLARSVPDARDIGDSLVALGVKLSLGGVSYDPADPDGQAVLQHPRDVRRVRGRHRTAAHP